MLTDDEFRARFAYDAETGVISRRQPDGSLAPAYLRCHDGRYWNVRCKSGGVTKDIRAHRLAFFLAHGYWPKEIDHINGDGKDNRLVNLRECTRSQNNAWAKSRKSALGHRGVAYRPDKNRGKPYRVRFSHEGQKIEVGHFETLEQASAAYNAAIAKLRGPFARLNASPGSELPQSLPQMYWQEAAGAIV